MAGTQINQNQISMGSETAIDLLAMQNGWKGQMITALNNKIAGYASNSDTMDTLVQKFAALTGNTPDTVFKIFKSDSGFGTVSPTMSAMPTEDNDSWEITVCKKNYSADVLTGDAYAAGGIGLYIQYGDADNGYIRATVPVYKEDESGDLETITLNDFGETAKYAFTQGTKYWIKLGYGDGKYYCKVSTDGNNDNYNTVWEITSSRKTQCSGHYDSPDTLYLDIRVGDALNKDILFLKECKVKIDGQTIFDGDDNLIMGTDVTWRDGAVYLVDIIQL